MLNGNTRPPNRPIGPIASTRYAPPPVLSLNSSAMYNNGGNALDSVPPVAEFIFRFFLFVVEKAAGT
jgi:hypothetical protein